MADEDEYLMLSGVQHFKFCRRQWALIHIEMQWDENEYTVAGELFHDRAHDAQLFEKRGDTLIARGLPVKSELLKIKGICDVVEFHRNDKNGVEIYNQVGKYNVYPVEYKVGKPKENDEDIVQLVAEAMCLEEMLITSIPKAYMYYGKTRHRMEITITDQMKEDVRRICKEMHQYYRSGYTPRVRKQKKCRLCSLKDSCLPGLKNYDHVSIYLEEYFNEKTS